ADASGAAYVFVRSNGDWSQQAYLKASNTGANDTFGESVAISGDTVVVGARNEDSSATGVDGDQTDNSASNAGAAYVFVRSNGDWSQQAYLKASNTEADDRFGERVSISGDTVVVGAYFEDSSATGVNGDQTDSSASNAGAVYLFTDQMKVYLPFVLGKAP
ncbi:MAG: FG-GAP repeat protein, partial [Anaerolineales bacterium]|nr:FG-GAP repeat protein [Anaerolineales bacterium]